MHVVRPTGSYFRSRNKDGGHAKRHSIGRTSGENPICCMHAHFTALCVIDAELLVMEFLHCMCGSADSPWHAGISCLCTCCGAFESYRMTDRRTRVGLHYIHTESTEIIYHAPSRAINNRPMYFSLLLLSNWKALKGVCFHFLCRPTVLFIRTLWAFVVSLIHSLKVRISRNSTILKMEPVKCLFIVILQHISANNLRK